MKTDTSHPTASTLALLAGGDLPLVAALQVRWHVHSCETCASELEVFRSLRREAEHVFGAEWRRQAAEDQPGESDPAWNALEAEMRANIRLGLTAGSLAEGSPQGPAAVPAPGSSLPWRWVAVCGALAFVLVAGWSLRAPGGAAVASAPVQDAPFAEPAARIQLLVPVADVSRTETDFGGSTRSQVIDSETGQVTLQQVYVE